MAYSEAPEVRRGRTQGVFAVGSVRLAIMLLRKRNNDAPFSFVVPAVNFVPKNESTSARVGALGNSKRLSVMINRSQSRVARTEPALGKEFDTYGHGRAAASYHSAVV
jgi:hypothetical protein